MKNKSNERSFLMSGRYIFCYWDDAQKRFVTTAFKDDDEDETIVIKVGDMLSHHGGLAGVNSDKPGAQSAKIMRLLARLMRTQNNPGWFNWKDCLSRCRSSSMIYPANRSRTIKTWTLNCSGFLIVLSAAQTAVRP